MHQVEQSGLTREQVLRRGAAGAVGLGALSVIGCGSGSGDKGASANAGGASKPPSKPTGLLKLGFPVGGTTHPVDLTSPAVGIIDYARNPMVCEPLVVSDSGAPTLHLAESIEAVGNDPKIWDVTLRDVKFSDGKPVRAEDLIATMKFLTAKDSAVAPNLAYSSLKKMGPRTVRFTLPAPQSNFMSKYGWGIFLTPEGFDPNKPIGTGPYTVISYQQGRKTVMKANPDYWGEGPFIETLEFYEFTDDTARVNALLAHQVDAIDNVPTANISAIKATPGMKFVEGPSDAANVLAMNMSQKPFDDVRVRQAMRLIVDRPQILAQVQSGHGVLGNDVLSPFDPAYGGLPQRAQDIEQAKSLLKAAGHQTLNVELVTANGVAPGWADLAQTVATQAKAAGVNVKVKIVDGPAYYTPQGGFGSRPFSSSLATGADYLATVAVILSPDAFFPETAWKDAEWTRIYREALNTIDEAKRKPLVAALMKIDHDRGTYLIPTYESNKSAFIDKLQGVKSQKNSLGLTGYQFNRLWLA